MATNDIQLTAGIRSNLLLLQSTTTLMDRTQNRLATGNKINSALDGPVAYFAAKGLNQRSDDLSALKDSIGQSISTIQAADTGATKIDDLVEQAKALTTTAFQNLGSDANSVALRKTLSDQFNTILRQIDKLAQDSTYQGKNLLVGSGIRLDATSSSKSATNALPGVSGSTVTNVTKADSYVVTANGDGSISANASDVANAEEDRGISNLQIAGFQSKTAGNFDPISIRYLGGVGKDKTFTVTEGDISVTKTFTVAQWNAAKSTNQVLNFDAQYASGTHVNFDINFDQIDDVPDTNGVGTSTIEKFVNIDMGVSNFNGVGQNIIRSGDNLLGQQKLADGQNAWSFDTGTVRMDVNENTILQSAGYDAVIGGAYGRAAEAIVGKPSIPPSGIQNDFTYTVTAAASPANFDFTSGHFTTYATTVQGPNTSKTVNVNADGTFTFTSIADNSQDVSIDFLRSGMNGITVASASDAADVETTKVVLGGVASAGDVSVSTISGLAGNLGHHLTVQMKTDSVASTFTLSDGYGGTAVVSATQGTSQTLTFTIVGGVNSGATLVLSTGANSLAANSTGTLTLNAIGQFTAPDQARFDVRAAQTGFTSTLNTIQVTDGNDSNNLTVQLNETNTTQITVVSQNLQTDGQGLAVDLAQNNWLDRADIDNSLSMLDAAKIKLQGSASALNNNLDIITTRLDYTKSFADVLSEGANKLVQADQNEEGANMLQLQTRQQLGTISLSLANQAQQAILRLF
jgi:flagellin-like hook-associated protein FlgL